MAHHPRAPQHPIPAPQQQLLSVCRCIWPDRRKFLVDQVGNLGVQLRKVDGTLIDDFHADDFDSARRLVAQLPPDYHHAFELLLARALLKDAPMRGHLRVLILSLTSRRLLALLLEVLREPPTSQ